MEDRVLGEGAIFPPPEDKPKNLKNQNPWVYQESFEQKAILRGSNK